MKNDIFFVPFHLQYTAARHWKVHTINKYIWQGFITEL